MASFAALTQNYQFAFGDGTVGDQWVFGGPGAGVQVLQVDGLEALPSLRTQDSNRGYMDGSFSGRDFIDARSVTFTLQIMSDNTNSMQTYLAELQKYLMPQRSGLNVLQVYLPGGRGVRRLYGRVRKRQITIDPQYVYGRAIAQLEFYCPDPRIYSDTASSYTINSLSSLSRSYNRTYNLTYPTSVSGSSGSVTLTNQGNYETWPSFSISVSSPSTSCSGVILTNYTTGDVLSFPNLTLGATDTLVLDSDLRTVLVSSSPARNTLSVTSRWFPLPPATPQIIGLSATTGTASCTITYRDAYI